MLENATGNTMQANEQPGILGSVLGAATSLGGAALQGAGAAGGFSSLFS
jgi:hypothetical protein